MHEKFLKAYLTDIISEASAGRVYGLCDFNFPKYTFRNVEVGDKLVRVWTSNRGESGNWGIQHWTVSAQEVEVLSVFDDHFVVTGDKQVPLKKSASKITTIEKTDTLRDPGLDRYDTGPWTEHGISHRKVKESYGDGIYPASFLLKYYNNTEKGYSLIGGGGSYSGPDFETLKEIASTEKKVKQIKQRAAVVTDGEADEKDIQRIVDILTKSEVTFRNYFDFYYIRRETDNKRFKNFEAWYDYTFPERARIKLY